MANDKNFKVKNSVEAKGFKEKLGTVTTGTGAGFSLVATKYDNKSFASTTQETFPTDFFLKPDGTKLYVLGTATDSVYQYSLSSAWDISSASYDSKSLDVSDVSNNSFGISFKSDGSKMFFVSGEDTVVEYDLSTNWDISTGTKNSNERTLRPHQGSSTDCRSVTFSNNGLKMFISDRAGDNPDFIYQYTLTTAWDVSTASFDDVSIDVGAQTNDLRTCVFNTDGTKMYHSHFGEVHQYTLTTAFDLSTASYDSVETIVLKDQGTFVGADSIRFSADGAKLYALDSGSDTIFQYSTASVKKILDLSTGSVFEIEADTHTEIALSNPTASGTVSAATLKLTTPLVMDIGNLTYDDVSSSSYTSGNSWFLAPNGRSGMWQNVVSEDVRGFRFASPWDLSTTTGYGSEGDGWRGVFNESATIANFTGLFGSPDGKFMYALSDSSNKLMRWSLVENPFNLSGTNPDQSLSVSGSFSDNTPTDLSFSLDGKWVYVMGNQDEQIKSKQLAVPWSLESAGSTIHTTLSEPPDPRNITFTPDGKTLLVYDRSNTGEVHQYSLSTAWDPRTKTYVKKKALTTSPGTSGSSMFSSTDRNYPKLYLGSSGGNQYQYTMDWNTYDISFDDNISFPGGAPSSFPLGGVTILTFSTTDGGTSYTASHALEEAILSYEIDISGDLPE